MFFARDLNISFLQVVVGQQFVVPAYSKVSLLQQPTQQDSDEELEYADSTSGTGELQCKFLEIYEFLICFF